MGADKNAKIKYLILTLLIVASFLLGRTTADRNNDDPRIQRIYDSVNRIESLSGSLDAGVKRIESASIAGQAGTQKIIGGIGTAISLMEDSAERERNRARNNQAATERVEFLENHFRKIYQREQEKTK